VNKIPELFTEANRIKQGIAGEMIFFFTALIRVVHRISTECGQILCELNPANPEESTKMLDLQN
jgi:hypothetical protein